jgi:hypothetical protein
MPGPLIVAHMRQRASNATAHRRHRRVRVAWRPRIAECSLSRFNIACAPVRTHVRACVSREAHRRSSPHDRAVPFERDVRLLTDRTQRAADVLHAAPRSAAVASARATAARCAREAKGHTDALVSEIATPSKTSSPLRMCTAPPSHCAPTFRRSCAGRHWPAPHARTGHEKTSQMTRGEVCACACTDTKGAEEKT